MKKYLIMFGLLTGWCAKGKQNNALEPTQTSFYDIEVTSIFGEKMDLSTFKGKKIMIVNVASHCGFTPQYAALESLYKRYQDKLVVIGVPCNQFGKQEPGSAEEIATFCKRNYGVTFPLTEKIERIKDSPLYQWLTNKEQNGIKNSIVRWNFQKYLVDEQGNLIDFFYSMTQPNSKKILRHLEHQ